jgi:hypothetical protein
MANFRLFSLCRIYSYMLPFQTENRSPGDINPFSVCPSRKQKFVICLFVYEETKGSYPFANGLN